MTMTETDKNAQLLARLKGWFEQAVRAPAYQTWRAEARMAWDFYDGAQWTAEDVARLAESGQPALVVNKIATKVDNLAGTEVAGRTRVIYRSRSGTPDEEAAAAVLSDLALYVAERSEQAHAVSAVFKAALVSGIGWLDIGVADSAAGPDIFCRVEDEMSVVWDPLSRSPDMSDARFVARERWMAEGDVRSFFPDKADKVLALLNQAGPLQGAGYGQGPLGAVPGGDDVAYVDGVRQLYRLVEMQYRESVKQYRYRLPDGRLAKTYVRDDVRRAGGTLEETVMVPRVQVAYFSGDTLLDARPLDYGHNQFTLTPFVYKRHRADGRPYGLVRAALDPQRELNKRRSKAMHLLNTAQVIADIDAVDDPQVLAREAARPDGIILKRAGKDLRILRNLDLAVSQVQVMEQAGRDIQDVMGVFDENIGKPSNASSGVAIQQRQLAGSMNQMFAFDTLRRLKKRMGEQVMELIRQFFTAEMVIAITDQLGASRLIHLNKPVIGPDGEPLRGADGEPLKTPDLTGGAFDVVVEEVRDVVSERELEAQRLQMLMQAGVPIPPAVLVEASGVREKDAILAGLGAPAPTKAGR